MLLANVSVAQHIAVHLPEQALLRRHDSPLERRLVSGDTFCSDVFTDKTLDQFRRTSGTPWSSD